MWRAGQVSCAFPAPACVHEQAANTMDVLVTGGTGFIGARLVERLLADGRHSVRIAVRSPHQQQQPEVRVFPVGDISADTDWRACLVAGGVVIHTAARAHVLHDTAGSPLQEFRRVNVEGTLRLASQAINAGVRRFVFLSSIGVNGSGTPLAPFDENSPPAPHADYARSKLEAEQGLQALVRHTGMELVIVRPPLVYAGHAPGNFQRLLRLVYSGLPLPLGRIENRRSLIALDNLVDFLVCCIEHPGAADQLFLVADDEDISTPEMVRHIAAGMGLPDRLWPVPNALLELGARLLGYSSMYSQLCGSLCIDSNKATRLLGWRPGIAPGQALQRAGLDYLRGIGKK